MELSLSQLPGDAAARLAEAARSARHPMHTPVVGTADGDLRIMVLREARPDLSLLRFHTDLRSPKAAVIAENPRVSVLAYDPEARLQLRMRGLGRIEPRGAVVDEAWNAATLSSRRCYLADHGPGTELPKPGSALPQDLLHRSPTIEESLPGREHFALLLVEVLALDWLQLTHEGGVRARFERISTRVDWQGTWLAP